MRRQMLLAIALFAFPALSHASTIIGTEDNSQGFTGPLSTSLPIFVASDGESPFFPFGVTFDVSDAIHFGPIPFIQAPGSTWQQLDPTTWVLPAVNENEPPFNESVGQWFSPGFVWTPNQVGDYIIMSADGTVSDIITLSNAPNGATVTFASDPIGTPEPASMTLLGVGIAGMAGYGWRRRKSAR